MIGGDILEAVVGHKEAEQIISLIVRARRRGGIGVTTYIKRAGRVLLKDMVNSSLKYG